MKKFITLSILIVILFTPWFLRMARTQSWPPTGPTTATPAISAAYATLPINTSSTSLSGNANKIDLNALFLPYAIQTSSVTYQVTSADSTANLYDIGLYGPCTASQSCSLTIDIGATAGTTFAPSNGAKTLSWTTSNNNLPPGRYYLAITTNCSSSCASLQAVSIGFAWITFTAAPTGNPSTSGGALLSSITTPADSWAGQSGWSFGMH